MDRVGLHNVRIQRLGQVDSNELLLDLPLQETSEQALDQGKTKIINALETNAPAGKRDLNNTSSLALKAYLLEKDPLHLGTDADQRYTAIAQAIVGAQLRRQAILATVYSLAGMLVYLAFRFELIYGVAAVITVFHDTLITLGAFSLTNKPISLTVIAAILTLIGYSNNDTIVVFDRIRENLKLMRREKLSDVVNRSINQTLSRTILTAGLTFLTVLALFLFGGEVLHGFSFALVIGILIGTYSSIAIAAPILVAYQDWRGEQGRPGTGPPAKAAPAAKGRVKA
jgi:preprotein translocase subunit SecF